MMQRTVTGRIVSWGAVFAALWFSSLYSYLLFHSLAEFFSIVIAGFIFVIAWSARRYLDNGYLLFIGVAYLFVAFLDLVHTLAYKGMGVFPGFGANLPTQLWIAARYMEALSLLLAPLFLRKRPHPTAWVLTYGLVTGLLMLSIFAWHIFPACYVEGAGLTWFKKGSEYLISMILVGAGIFLWRRQTFFTPHVLHLLLWSIGITILAEIAFTFYISVYGVSNMVGHFAKILSFYLIYRALILTGVTKPQEVLFKQLQDSEERFRNLVGNVPGAVCRCLNDDQWTMLFLSKGIEGIIGFPASEFIENRVRSFASVIHPEDRDRVNQEVQRGVASREPYLIEYRLVRSDGHTAWVYEKGHGVWSKDGRLQWLDGVILDITARKKAENGLARSEARYRNMVESAGEGIVVLDSQEQTTFANQRMAQMLGVTSGELPGMRMLDLVHPEERDDQLQKIALRRAGTQQRFERRLMRKDGTIIWTQVSCSPLQDKSGNYIGAQAMFTDVTERKQAEEARKEREAELSAIYESAPIIMMLVDKDRRVLRINGYGQKFAGVSEEEMIGLRGGDALRCLNALDDPEGCGFGSQCGQCTIRRTVLDTLETGQSHHLIEASLPFLVEGERKEFTLLVSTSRITVGATHQVLVSIMDITERKRTEEELRQSEERFRSMAMLLPEIIFETDTKGRFTFLNQAAFDRMGYSQDDFERGLNSLDMLIPQDRARAGENIKKVLAGQELELREYTAQTKDGATFPCLVRTAAIIKDGVPIGLRGFSVDITDRKEAEEALQRSEEQFRAAFESAPEGMALIDKERRFLKVNPRLCEILGYSENELLGKSFNQFTHSDDRQAGRDRWKELISGKASVNRSEKRFIHKDGQVIWVVISNAAIYNHQSELQYVLSHIYDITDHKKADEALRLSEEKFAKAFKHSPMWVVITSLHEGRYIDVNEAFLKDTGFTRDEVIDHTASDLNLRLDSQERDLFKQMLLEQGPVHNMEVKRRVRSGEVLDMLLSAEVLPMPGEEVIVAVLADVTALKKGQKEKEMLEAQLRRAQKLEAMGTLAGGIAHDFNNILAAIMGYSELAQVTIPVESESQEYLSQILSATTRAQKLVKQILTFSRKAELDVKPLDLASHVAETVDLIKQTIPRMVSVELRMPKDLWHINGDASQLEQVLMNLITNANHAMPDGGKLVIEADNVFLPGEYCEEHLEAKPGDYVRLQVSDTGQGMTKEVMGQIFDPFFTTKEAGKGTGLGLSMVYGIVKAHGGFIYCYSEPGQGTTFRVYFPALKTAEEQKSQSLKDRIEAYGGNETILLVDDEEPLRKLGQLLLSREGYHVISAGTGEEALEIYQQEGDKIDLVILDVSMPGMGGHNCLKEILNINSDAKILIASGYSAGGPLKDTLASGASGYIAKPFERTVMLRIIRDVLDKGKLK